MGLLSITFEVMLHFHSKFTEEYLASFNIEIICKILTELWHFLVS